MGINTSSIRYSNTPAPTTAYVPTPKPTPPPTPTRTNAPTYAPTYAPKTGGIHNRYSESINLQSTVEPGAVKKNMFLLILVIICIVIFSTMGLSALISMFNGKRKRRN